MSPRSTSALVLTPLSWDDRCPWMSQSGLSFSLFVHPKSHLSCSSRYPIATLASFQASTPFLVNCRFRIRNFHRLWHRKMLCTRLWWFVELNPLSAMWSWWSFDRVDSKRFLVDSWYSTMHAYFVFLLDSVIPLAAVSCSSLKRILVPILQSIAASIGTSTFFPALFDGFLALSIFQIEDINTSQFSSFVELWFFTCPFLFFFLLISFGHSWPNSRPQVIWSGSCLNLCESSPGTPASFGMFFVQYRERRESCPWVWHSSVHVDITIVVKTFSCNTSRHVCVVLLTSLYFNGIGMILLSAHRHGLEVRRDDDKWSLLPLTRSRYGLQRHLLVLSVEDLPVRLEVLHWDLRSPQVVPALEWVLWIRGLFLTILLYHLLLGM